MRKRVLQQLSHSLRARLFLLLHSVLTHIDELLQINHIQFSCLRVARGIEERRYELLGELDSNILDEKLQLFVVVEGKRIHALLGEFPFQCEKLLDVQLVLLK